MTAPAGPSPCQLLPTRAGFAGTEEGLAEVARLVDVALNAMQAAHRKGPLPAGGPARAAEASREGLPGPLLPEWGGDPAESLAALVFSYTRWAVDLAHPAAAGRMQCPPLAVAAVAELVAAALNQSLHVWESGPSAVELERRLIAELATLVGFPSGAQGTLTAGGSISNMMGLLLARDHAVRSRTGRDASSTGLAGLRLRPRVLCSESAHFSVARAAGFLGLGKNSVISVPTDPSGRMRPEAAERRLADLRPGDLPIALVATAGTTDFGAFDPLPELSAVARRHGLWLHVDAAYGGCALFSRRLSGWLDGLAEGDSVSLDLHKFGWTPGAAAIFLVGRPGGMSPLTHHASYVNPPDDCAAGLSGLLATSLQTTRRADALKVVATLRVMGRRGMEAMVDACHDLARHAAARIVSEGCLELAAPPVLSTVVFRCRSGGRIDADELNATVRRRLILRGQALLTRTRVRQPDGSRALYLKLVLLSPTTRPSEVDAVIDDIVTMAMEVSGTQAESSRTRSGVLKVRGLTAS